MSVFHTLGGLGLALSSGALACGAFLVLLALVHERWRAAVISGAAVAGGWLAVLLLGKLDDTFEWFMD